MSPPVFTVTAITHRKDPIFRHMQATWFTDHQPLITLPMEATYYNRLRETHGNTNVIDVFVPPWASQFMMIVQVEARHAAAIRLLRGELPADAAFDKSLTMDEVLKAVQPFVKS